MTNEEDPIHSWLGDEEQPSTPSSVDRDEPLHVDGAELLHDVAEVIRRHVVFPDDHCLTAVTLWAAHTHAPVETFYVTPRLILDSAEPGSGKTRVLELLDLLVLAPEQTISATVAAIFRMLAEEQHTLLFDEVDAIFNPKNGGNYEDLRALLNAGYKRGSSIARCVGDAKSMKVQRFPVFAPVALAGLAGKMPATITSRAITIHMRRRAPGERVSPFRERDVIGHTSRIRTQLNKWITGVSNELSRARPELPNGVVDRPAEVWEALVAVADAAGGDWPDKARAACAHFVLDAKPEAQSLGIRLLADLLSIFTRRQVDAISSADLVTVLVADPEAPWADMYGKPLDQRRLARELKRYGVTPGVLRRGDSVFRGYETTGEQGLLDAWRRYLPDSDVTTVTTATAQVSDSDSVTDVTHERNNVTTHNAPTSDVTDATAVTRNTCPGCGSSFDDVVPVVDSHLCASCWTTS